MHKLIDPRRGVSSVIVIYFCISSSDWSFWPSCHQHRILPWCPVRSHHLPSPSAWQNLSTLHVSIHRLEYSSFAWSSTRRAHSPRVSSSTRTTDFCKRRLHMHIFFMLKLVLHLCLYLKNCIAASLLYTRFAWKPRNFLYLFSSRVSPTALLSRAAYLRHRKYHLLFQQLRRVRVQVLVFEKAVESLFCLLYHRLTPVAPHCTRGWRSLLLHFLFFNWFYALLHLHGRAMHVVAAFLPK